jgi:plastocyanin
VRAVLATATAAVALVTVAGCGDADDAATSGGPTAATSASTSAASSPAGTSTSATTAAQNVVAVDVTITGGQVEPPPARVDVRQGQSVRITVTSDEADELHVHGYEAEAELPPGQAVTIEIVADQTGLFEVETHEQGLQLFQLVVQ